jgi:catechol 2,3-dioxygenase-like lactoylglutathione lyase family enzyme
MTEPTYHHVGVLVADMDSAIAWFSEVAGIQFHPPQRMATHGRIDPGEFGDEEPHDGVSYLAWSKDGPAYYELAEAKGTGLHSLERHGAGLHHVGIFVQDVDDTLARLGVETEGRVLGPDGRTMVCWTLPSEITGLTIEFLDERLRPGIQQWIDTCEPPQVPATVSSS